MARSRDEERLIRRSLGKSNTFWLILLFLGGMGGLGFLGFGSVGVLLGPYAGLAFGVVAVVLGVLLFVVLMLIERRRSARETRWMKALPFAFDIDDYLDHLGHGRSYSQVTLRLEFTDSLDAGGKQQVEALANRAELERHVWKKRSLHLRSEPLETRFQSSGDGDSRYNNAAVHQWVRATVDGSVLSIHKQHELAMVQVDVVMSSPPNG